MTDHNNHAFCTSNIPNDKECLSDESNNSSNLSNNHGCSDTALMEATTAASFLTNSDSALMEATTATIFDNATTAVDDVFHVPDFAPNSSICKRCAKISPALATPQSDLNTSNTAKDLRTAMHQHASSSAAVSCSRPVNRMRRRAQLKMR
jgi:hypothetical protein